MGHIEVVRRLLTCKDIQIDRADKDGDRAIHEAVLCSDVDILGVLIHHGANVNALDGEGRSPLALCHSPSTGSEIISMLVDHGAEIYTGAVGGITILHRVCYQGDNPELVVKLISTGQDVNEKTLYGKAQHRIKPQKPNVLFDQDVSALHIASARGYVSTIEVLVQAGAAIELQDEAGRTALHLASGYGHYSCVKALIKAGANVNPSTKGWLTPLMLACMNDPITDEGGPDASLSSNQTTLTETLTALLLPPISSRKRKPAPCVPDIPIVATDTSRALCVAILLNSGADHGLKTAQGCGPLHLACEFDHSTCVSELVSVTEVDPHNIHGDTPLMLCCKSGKAACLEPLIKAQADFTSTNRGRSPVQVAAEGGHVKCLKLLLGCKPTINHLSPDSPRALAIKNDHDRILHLLAEYLHSSGKEEERQLSEDEDVSVSDVSVTDQSPGIQRIISKGSAAGETECPYQHIALDFLEELNLPGSYTIYLYKVLIITRVNI